MGWEWDWDRDQLDLVFFGVVGHRSSSVVDLGLGWYWSVGGIGGFGFEAKDFGISLNL